MKTRPVAEAVGDQPAADPVLLADDLVFEVGADAEDGADRGVAIDRVEGLVLAGLRWLCTSQVSRPSIANTVPQRRGLSDSVIQARRVHAGASRLGARI